MEMCDLIFPSKSEMKKAVFKLMFYAKHYLKFDEDLIAQEGAEEAAEKGLRNRQIRYFFNSYAEGREKYKERYAFLDKAREFLAKESFIDLSLLEKQEDWLTKQNMNNHLAELVERGILIEAEGPRYQLNDSYLDSSLPYYCKSLIRGAKTNQMIGDALNYQALLVYRLPREELPVKKGMIDDLERDILAQCAAFGQNIGKIHERWFTKAKRPPAQQGGYESFVSTPTIIITPSLVWVGTPK